MVMFLIKEFSTLSEDNVLEGLHDCILLLTEEQFTFSVVITKLLSATYRK